MPSSINRIKLIAFIIWWQRKSPDIGLRPWGVATRSSGVAVNILEPAARGGSSRFVLPGETNDAALRFVATGACIVWFAGPE